MIRLSLRGTVKTGNWWDENVLSQTETDKMLFESLTSLTGQKSDKKAWDALFRILFKPES